MIKRSQPDVLSQTIYVWGLWDGFFDRPKALLGTELAAGQWMNFDLSTLSSENIGIIHAVLSWFLYHVVNVGKTAMDIYIDEGWRLLRSGPFADLLDELGRRARKRNIGVTLITHMPKELAENPTSLNMASTVFIGKTQPDEAFAFFQSMVSHKLKQGRMLVRCPVYKKKYLWPFLRVVVELYSPFS